MRTPHQTRGIALGRLFGARVVLKPSAIVMVGFLAYIFATSAGEVTQRTLLLGAMLGVLLFASVFVHELAHAFAARLAKREVKEVVLTLWGGHTTFDVKDMSPKAQAWTAAAGPIANTVIALVAHVTIQSQLLSGSPASVASWLGWANVFLAVFNILPGIPMDGGRVLEAIVWAATGNRHRGTIVAAWGGRVVALGVIAYALASPVLRGQGLDLVTALWAFFIASLLWPAATAALRYSQTADRRENTVIANLMIRAVGVEHTLTVEQARQAASEGDAAAVVVLAVDGAAAGHFPMSTTDMVPPDLRVETGLQAVTMPVPRGAEVDEELSGEDLVRTLRDWWGRTEVWVVRKEARIVGVVRLQDVLAALK